MANKNAIVRKSLQYVSGGGGMIKEPAAGGVDSVQSPYRDAEPDSQILVPDATVTATEYAVPFGSVAAATLLEIENKTGQDIKATINPPPPATGTLVAGTKDIALANAVGDHLQVQLVTAGGTPGVLSVKRKSNTEVTVQSWLAGTGLQALDISDVQVFNLTDFYRFQLPANGVLIVACPALPAAGKITGAKVKTTATQSGDGTVIGRVFGDPL